MILKDPKLSKYMRLKVASLLLVCVMLASTVPTSIGYSNGKFNSGSSGCNCHGYNSASISMSGQPSSYTPGTTYNLQITVGSGSGNGGFSLDANKGTLAVPGGVGIMAVKVNSQGSSATHTTSSTAVGTWIGPHQHQVLAQPNSILQG